MTYNWHISGVKTWTIVQADKHGRVTIWVEPGWYRRVRSHKGVITEPSTDASKPTMCSPPKTTRSEKPCLTT